MRYPGLCFVFASSLMDIGISLRYRFSDVIREACFVSYKDELSLLNSSKEHSNDFEMIISSLSTRLRVLNIHSMLSARSSAHMSYIGPFGLYQLRSCITVPNQCSLFPFFPDVFRSLPRSSLSSTCSPLQSRTSGTYKPPQHPRPSPPSHRATISFPPAHTR